MRGLAVLAILTLGAWAQRSDDGEASITEGPAVSVPSQSSSSSSGPSTRTIAVGASGHKFTDSETFADVGDILEFIFYPSNHSVVRAEYRFPCVPYEMHGVGRVGFNSGFQPVRAITNDPPVWRVRVNNTDPIFFYCGADGSCYKNHMIAVVNPNETQTLEKHLEAAEGLTFQVLPGEPYPEESGYAPPSRPTPTPNDGDGSPSAPPASESQKDGLNGGEIAGIVIGASAVLLIAGALIYLCGRRGGIDMAHRRATFTTHHPSTISEANYTVGTKSPGIDSRWSAARWSLKSPSSLYREQASPPVLAPVGMPGHPHPSYGVVPGMESQHTGLPQHAGFVPVAPAHDPRMSQTSSPPPGALQSPSPRTPVELPSESGQSPGQARYSWVGQETDATFRASR